MKFISSIAFIIIVVILFIFLVDPLYKDVKQLRTNVSAYNVALNNSTELQKTRDSLVETYKNVKKEDKERLNHFLPDTIDNIKLILEIEKIANLHGMPIGNIKFDTKNLEEENSEDKNKVVVAENNPSDYLPYGIFPMEFTIEGKYDTFIAFLKDLEQNLRLVDVKSISFDVPSSSVASDIYSYTLKVEIYWLK